VRPHKVALSSSPALFERPGRIDRHELRRQFLPVQQEGKLVPPLARQTKRVNRKSYLHHSEPFGILLPAKIGILAGAFTAGNLIAALILVSFFALLLLMLTRFVIRSNPNDHSLTPTEPGL
jgi:hypothetical protein